MSHAGVKEYFQTECRTQVSRSIVKLNVTCGGSGKLKQWGVKGAEGLNTIERFETLLNTIEYYWTLLNTIEHYWTLLNTF